MTSAIHFLFFPPIFISISSHSLSFLFILFALLFCHSVIALFQSSSSLLPLPLFLPLSLSLFSLSLHLTPFFSLSPVLYPFLPSSLFLFPSSLFISSSLRSTLPLTYHFSTFPLYHLLFFSFLHVGNEGSIDRLMKQISSFMTEIGDEFKIVVVKAIRELCIKYPAKHRSMVRTYVHILPYPIKVSLSI